MDWCSEDVNAQARADEHARNGGARKRHTVDRTDEQIGIPAASSSQGIILAIEQISSMAKANRGKAESVDWTIDFADQREPQFAKVIDR